MSPSTEAGLPAMRSLMIVPVIAARRIPFLPCPVAYQSPLALGSAPMIGRPSGVMGRSPAHVRVTSSPASGGQMALTPAKIRASPAAVVVASKPAYSMVEPTTASLPRAREAILARHPGLLAIDDAHALDEASAALAHQLVGQDGVRVVATVRRGEEVPDAIVGLWKDGLCERVDL